jgi:hypothetical protein
VRPGEDDDTARVVKSNYTTEVERPRREPIQAKKYSIF